MLGLNLVGKQQVECREQPEPELRNDGDVIVRVELAGICGSDLHVYHERETGLDHDTVLGHEFVGEVVDVGKGCRSLAKGQRVLSPFSTSCGQCFYCRRALTARCERGALFGWVQDGQGLHGGQAEYLRVPLADSTLVPLAEGLSATEGLLLGDVLSTGHHCALGAGAGEGGLHVVVGCGPVGLMAVACAWELGADRVVALDTVPERLAKAEEFGAEAIDIEQVDPVAFLREASEGRGADGVLEAVGSTESARLAMDLLRPGGRLSMVGVHTAGSFPFSPVEAYDKNLQLSLGRCPARAHLPGLVPMVQSRRRDLASIVTHRRRLSEGAEAYGIFDRREDGCIKAVLEP